MKSPKRNLMLLHVIITMASLHSLSCLGQQEKRIVFVCEHGAARSAIASAYFNKLAAENQLPYRSSFVGLTPDSTLTRATREGLKGDGFDVENFRTAQLTYETARAGDVLISLDCEVPPSFNVTEQWNGIPAISKDYTAARQTIVRHVDNLIRKLKSEVGKKQAKK